MTETLPLAEIKAHLSEIVDRIERTHQRVLLTRNGRPAAVLISPDDLASLEETLEILADDATMKAIRDGEEAVARGDTVSADDLRRKYLRG